MPTGRAFNAYGDVVSTSIDGTIQEQFEYNLAGQVVKTNSGDGVWKFFVYDKLGQASITIASAGYDLASVDVETAISLISELDVNATYTIYDKRGLAIQTIEEDRDVNGLQTVYTESTYNAFGETQSESNAEGWTTDYRYNTMGRLIERQLPEVRVVREDGTEEYVRTADSYYYDVSGRLIGSRDANGNLTTRQLLAGTGHEGSDALATREFYADGGSVATAFDVHRNARLITDQIGRVTEQQFDAMGRVTEVALASGLVNHYAYDGLGQRTKVWNNVLGTAEAETTEYDAMGRVIASRTAGGDITTNTYIWDELLATTGFGAYGGWIQTTSTDADRASSVDGIYAAARSSDAFGHVITRIDKGGQSYIFEYDVAGRLVTENSTLNSADLRYTSYTYYNTGKISQVISGEAPTETGNWTRKVAGYEFNALGLLSREYVAIETGLYVPEHWVPVEGPSGPPYRMEPPEEGDEENWTYVEASYSFTRNYIQDGYANYDEHGRIIQYREGEYAPDVIPPAANKQWLYDAVGNVRAIITDYRPMRAGGTLSGSVTDQIFWYRYDSMNRVVTTKGTFVGEAGSGHIERGTEGTDLSYNTASQRMTAQTGVGAQEVYTYNAADLVTNVAIGGITRATNSYDLLGRLTDAVEYDASSILVYNRHDIVYDVRGLVLAEKTQTKQGSDWIYTHTVSSYSATGAGTATPAISFAGEAGNATGSILYYTETKYWKNGSASPVYGTVGSYSAADLDYADTYVTHNYLWRDGAVQDTVQLVNRDGSSTSSYFYDRDGFLSSVSITGGTNPRSLYYTNNLQGQVLARTETTGVATQTYMFGGKQMGVVSNDGTGNVDYVTSLADRTGEGGSGVFRNGAATGVAYADFDVNFDHLNGNRSQGGSSGYVVAAGDTLGSIASSVWGDANLWYKIAQANGLTGNEALIAGTMLSIPGSISNIHHDADTFRPYDPAEAIGNTSPNTPKPPKAKNKCGIFGQILMIAIAVAVSALTYGALTGPSTGFLGAIGAGAASGSAGSIASQGFGVATGIQDKFNWKGVGLAAISGAVGGGLGKLGSIAKAGSALDNGLSNAGNFLGNGGFAGDVTRGVLSSGLSQGISAATGLQRGFSWSGVAAAGIMAGSIGVVSRSMANPPSGNPWNSDGSPNQAFRGASLANSLIASAAGSLANAASRSVLQGTGFGDNLIAALPDVIGGTVGTLASAALKSAFATESAPAPEARPSSTPAAGVSPEELRYRAEMRSFQLANGRFPIMQNYGSEPAGPYLTVTPAGLQDSEIVVTAQRSDRGDNWLKRWTGIDLDWEARSLSLSIHIGRTDLRAGLNFDRGIGFNLNLHSGRYNLGLVGSARYGSGTLALNGAAAAGSGNNRVAVGGTASISKSALSAGVVAEAKIGSISSNIAAGGSINKSAIAFGGSGNASVGSATLAAAIDGNVTAQRLQLSGGASLQSSVASASAGLALDMNEKTFLIGGSVGGLDLLGHPVGTPGFQTATADGNKILRQVAAVMAAETWSAATEVLSSPTIAGANETAMIAAPGAAKSLINEAHLAEMAANGVKFSPGALLATGRSSSTGQVIFLETGNARAGLQHIVDRHGADFAKIGVPEAQIPEVVMRAASEGKLVGYQGAGQGRGIYEILLHQQNQRIAVTVGNNGFIVGANPAGRVP